MVLGCEINFDQNAHGVYFAGQTLSGRVNITLDKPKKLKGVRIQIAGQARTRWNERVHRFVDGRPEKKEVFYQADETFLDSKAYLRQGADDGSATGALIELPAGQHTYTFACALPPMLPTSFEGLFGHIRYTVKVVLERPWKFDQTYKVAFTVLKELDLNVLSPILRIPTQMENSNSFWCGPCTSGQLTIVASIPQSGYVPGQNIAITAEVTNMSHIPVDYMRFSLRKVVLYKSQVPSTKTKLELDVVQERRTGSVGRKDHRRFEVIIAIPPIPPTNTNLCKVIEIAYEVKVEAKVSGPHTSPFVLIPITIGTVPLNRNTPDPKTPSIVTAPALPICEQPSPTNSQPPPHDQLAAPPLYSNGPCGSRPTDEEPVRPARGVPMGTSVQPILAAISSGQRQQILNNIPPPSYEESLRGNHIIEDAEEEQHPIGQQPYTPRYVVYNFDAHQQQQQRAQISAAQAAPAMSALPVPAFTMTMPEARLATMREAASVEAVSDEDATTQTISASRMDATRAGVAVEGAVVVVADGADERTAAENERHAAKLRANMETWT